MIRRLLPIGTIGIVASAWVVLFLLNHWLFTSLEIHQYIAWIFLPAAVRMLAVMQFGWIGAIGLFVGALVTNGPILLSQPAVAFSLSALSAIGPVIATYMGTRILAVPRDIGSLDMLHLYVFAALGAVCSSVLHNLYFWRDGVPAHWEDSLVPMLLGDMLGTTIVLIAGAVVLRWRRAAGPTELTRSD
nr:hypothetical protein [Dechloromonas sp.]